MNPEDYGENPAIIEIIERQFLDGQKLESGTVNNFTGSIYSWFRLDQKTRKQLGPFKKQLNYYEEFVRKIYAPGTANLIMKKSDPETITAFDAVIDEMRTKADEIARGGVEAVEPYLARLRGMTGEEE